MKHEKVGVKRARWVKQREKILNVVGRLFWHKGYLGTSISDIARGARINKSAVYYYFGDKNLILYELASRSMQALMDLATPVMNSRLTPAEKLEALIMNQVKWQATNTGLAGIGQLERRNLPPKLLAAYIGQRDEYEAIYRNVIGQIAAENGNKRLDPPSASLFVLGLVNSVVMWYKPGGSLSPEEIGKEIYRIFCKAWDLKITA